MVPAVPAPATAALSERFARTLTPLEAGEVGTRSAQKGLRRVSALRAVFWPCESRSPPACKGAAGPCHRGTSGRALAPGVGPAIPLVASEIGGPRLRGA